MTEFKLTDITPNLTDEDAQQQILSWLHRNPNKQIFSIDEVIGDYLLKNKPPNLETQSGFYKPVTCETVTGSEPFYDAIWYLCSRSILRPYPIREQNELQFPKNFSAKFVITQYGRSWLEKFDTNNCTPSEYGRFSQLLSSRVYLFGDGYNSRSQEAIGCYRSHNYFSCCVMCGSAYESVLLALAIKKKGNEDEILTMYSASQGRSRVENYLIGQKNQFIQKEFRKYTDLLKYWRDDASHGAASSIQEEEAYTSLILLLRFVQFAEKNFAELTSP
ncbi:hypothetical protein [Anabaena azotica]|uniref:hypothetical protein n=1 Tax=Anabaena azotica TaxID=197653 RepID=UPI0039A4868F